MKRDNLTGLLLQWYHTHKRDLPWRRTKDPYLVWLSEIILQQTRVEQGLPYYIRFAETFPTIGDMEAAGEQEILKLWQGLGYYTRARNLYAAAKRVMSHHAGVFPHDFHEIRKLPGIGDYTAAAIASICFGLPYAVVDGNVIRFVARLHGIHEPADLPATRNRIREIVTSCMDRENPGDYNQALMEFGAMVCTPSTPACPSCPFRERCYAFRHQCTGNLPVRKEKPALRVRWMHYLVITARINGVVCLYLKQRTGRDIWRNLFDFPAVETTGAGSDPDKAAEQLRDLIPGGQPELPVLSAETTHLLTHRKLLIRFYRLHYDMDPGLPWIAVPLHALDRFPLPKPVERYVAGLQISQNIPTFAKDSLSDE